MCGIAGFWGAPDRPRLEAMTDVLRHRGPDDHGFFESPAGSLGFRRLSIIDLAGGHQPMGNEDGRVQLAYNGEIYNFRELRAELSAAGHTFRTASDSEVIVHAYEEWGEDCFPRFNGMWAVALLDLRGPAPRMVLARDHFGIKPLYWTRAAGRLLFASEIKSLLQSPEVERRPDEQHVYEYLLYGYHEHDEGTFFAGIQRVPAACRVVVDAGGMRVERYWEPRLGEDADPDPRRFLELFERSVERRLVADVPVGTCLSGGLDSSSVVCVEDRLLRRGAPDAASLGDRLKTFSALFDGDPIDERAYVQTVLEHVPAEGYEVRPRSDRFVEELGELVWHQEEPTVSTGPYAQWCVMRLAAEHVRVTLDGQGGDELLAGYVPYHFVYLRQLLRQRRWGRLLREAWASRDLLAPLVRRRLAQRRRSVPVRRLLRPDFLARVRPPRIRPAQDDLKRRLLEDLTLFSLPSLLRYEDRNSMAHSVESRLPFLDQELVEYILRLPPEAIIDGGWSRAIFRRAMKGILPERIRLRRWKVGFTTPEMRWLKARRASIQSLLRSPSFAARPWWDGPAVADAFAAACEGRLEDSFFFWRAINLELWMRSFIDPAEPPAGPADPFALGDRVAARSLEPAAAKQAEALIDGHPAHAGRQLLAHSPVDGGIWARLPLTTRLVRSGDRLEEVLAEALEEAGAVPAGGDILALSEKVVAISQGRSFPVEEVKTSWLAVQLSRFVRRTASGIGLGIPATMELALRTAGAPRILLAAAAGAVGRLLGVRGLFYRVAGHRVSAIDGPTAGTIPPYNGHAKLPPAEPGRVAQRLADWLGARYGARVGVAVVDANDIGVEVLGTSAGTDPALVASLFRDNPLGQGSEQTPLAWLRRLDRAPAASPASPAAAAGGGSPG
ncbi:MAG: asparagine synthase (glutamine-hydrolyzing) [Bacillota bacterium]|nr:asparagine synthase (glutamine-hydrolyzing) [Bacillota bacterium]